MGQSGSKAEIASEWSSWNPLDLLWDLLNGIWGRYLFRRLSIRSGEGEFGYYWDENPLLGDSRTANWIRREKPRLLVLMRGLPGSGKSTLAQKLKNSFPDMGFICSADDYFTDSRTGEYKFRYEYLPEAHGECQKRGLDAIFELKKSLVIVDNTSLSKWEMDPYFSLANSSGYILLIFHPQTPWAGNPPELARKNLHGVSEESISHRLHKALNPPLPIYYAWFLSQSLSSDLIAYSYGILKRCLALCPDLREEIRCCAFLREEEDDNLFGFYNVPSRLHCTAKYLGQPLNFLEQDQKLALSRNIGKVHDLKIYGFTISRYAFGARVSLEDSALKIYQEEEDPYVKDSSSLYQTGPTRRRNSDRNAISVETTDCFQRSVVLKEININHPKFFTPSFENSKRSHITLGVGPGSRPVNAGFDTLRTANKETSGTKFASYEIPDVGVLRKMDTNLWSFYLIRQIVVQGIFSGYYC